MTKYSSMESTGVYWKPVWHRRAGRIAVVIVASLMTVIGAAPAGGEENAAAARIEAMANFLAKAQRLGVAADCAYDVVQDSGQKIEFAERREVRLRRPDRARVDVMRRDGSRRGIVFDGTQLTAFDVDAKVYATVAKAGTIDAALTYYTQELGMRLPLRELFAADLPQQLKPVLGSARLVGPETVRGVATDHVALRGDAADVQLWIARDGDPLPQRVVITYRLAAGQPQFEADFHGWTLNPDVPDAVFTFAPAAGAERIPILTPGRGREGGKAQP
jgi:hypothetical protein